MFILIAMLLIVIAKANPIADKGASSSVYTDKVLQTGMTVH